MFQSVMDAANGAFERATTAAQIGPADNIKDHFRSLEIIILNKCAHPLEFGNRYYFDSGQFYTQPLDVIKARDIARFTVCNVAGSVMQGVTGAVQYKILGTTQYLHVGFCNPAIGSYKYFIGVSPAESPKFGYDECVEADEDFPFTSTHYPFAMQARLRDGEIVQKIMEFTIEHSVVAM